MNHTNGDLWSVKKRIFISAFICLQRLGLAGSSASSSAIRRLNSPDGCSRSCSSTHSAAAPPVCVSLNVARLRSAAYALSSAFSSSAHYINTHTHPPCKVTVLKASAVRIVTLIVSLSHSTINLLWPSFPVFTARKSDSFMLLYVYSFTFVF